MHANCVFFSRPMKRKSGTSAGIPRASGERGSPGAPARDKEVRKAPSPLPIATRRVLVPSRCGFSFFFLLCFFVVVSDQAPMIPSGPRVGERETRKCVCLPSGRTGVAGGLVGLGASARWAGWGRVAARIHAAAQHQPSTTTTSSLSRGWGPGTPGPWLVASGATGHSLIFAEIWRTKPRRFR